MCFYLNSKFVQKLYEFSLFLQIFDSKKILWYHLNIFKTKKLFMWATTQTHDDDLIILSDDTSTEAVTEEMIISEDLQNTSNDVISFDAEETSENSEFTNTSDETILSFDEEWSDEDNKNNDVELNFDLDAPESEKTLDLEEPIMELDSTEETETLEVTEESTDEPETNNDDLMLGGLDLESAGDNTDEEKHDLLSEKEEEDNGFDLTDEVVEESVSDLDLTEEVPSMEDILSQTIAKLTERQEHVLGEEEKENSHISKLEDQIKALEEEKLAAENTKKDLQAESKQISANITKLEKMKDSDTDKK